MRVAADPSPPTPSPQRGGGAKQRTLTWRAPSIRRPPGSRTRPKRRTRGTCKKVGHVYRRAAFGANLQRTANGLQARPGSPHRLDLLQGGEPSAQYDAETEKFLATAAKKFNAGAQASAWWLYRMLHGGHPLREKLTLFWHNHFATSNAKVQNAGYMLGQYELMHKHALGNFAELLQEMSNDPAMMIWLDTVQSKKGQPNENYARELMELFSLGIGNYTEKDIREAARAFTGWEIQNGKFFNNKAEFDATEKTVLGQDRQVEGRGHRPHLPGTEVVPALHRPQALPLPRQRSGVAAERADRAARRAVSRTATTSASWSRRCCARTCSSRTRLSRPHQVARRLRPRHRARARSQDGHAKHGPQLDDALENLGQNVFHPPSVKGWDGGQTWLNGQTLLAPPEPGARPGPPARGLQGTGTGLVLAQAHGKKIGREAGRLLPRICSCRATCRPKHANASSSTRRLPKRRSCRHTGRNKTPPTTA